MLQIYNTLGGRLEPFYPVDPAVVTLFTCGPSVYQRAHIGNFRTFVFEDLLVRYLKYAGLHVRRGMNLTDLEDKALAEARRQGIGLRELTDRNIAVFRQDMRHLCITAPDLLPRASDYVDQAVELIETLLTRGIAYRHRRNIYFDTLKAKGFGRLAGIDPARWPARRIRFHRDTYPGMRWNLGDFILWHGNPGPGEPVWQTAIGPGRPSWNIEDPAMISAHFDETLSIYCGGIDNLVRHHDYSLAILEACRPYPMARYWMHSRHLLVEGRKMSKSSGNIVQVSDLLQQGYTGGDIRFFLLGRHYRQRQNFTPAGMHRAAERRANLRGRIRALQAAPRAAPAAKGPLAEALKEAFTRAMDNDLDLPAALAAVEKSVFACNPATLPPPETRALLHELQHIDKVLLALF